jgi:hypothetical protein
MEEAALCFHMPLSASVDLPVQALSHYSASREVRRFITKERELTNKKNRFMRTYIYYIYMDGGEVGITRRPLYTTRKIPGTHFC